MSNASACLPTHLQSESTVNISWVSFWLRQHTWYRWSKAVEKKEHSLSAGSFYSPASEPGKQRQGAPGLFAGQLVYSKWWVRDSLRDPKLCRSLSRNWYCYLLTLRESTSFQGLVLPVYLFIYLFLGLEAARLRDLPIHSQSPCEPSLPGSHWLLYCSADCAQLLKWQPHRMIMATLALLLFRKKNNIALQRNLTQFW